MKTRFLLFFFLTTSLLSFSQDTRLFENTWYLHNLIIDGVDNIPPVNDEIPYVAANFTEPDLFSTGMCESGGGGQVVYNGTTEFTFLELIFLTGGCYENFPYNENFNQLYVGQYWFASDQNPYSYTITEIGSDRTLSILNSNGDEAIFGNELLSTISFDNESFSIYPNPTNEFVHIEAKDLKAITIFNSLGKQSSFKELSGERTTNIDVSNLAKGVYTVVISTSSRQVVKKLIIK